MAGLYFGGMWLALTFTPSLTPRPWLFQGVLGGIAFALGYWFGATLIWLWNYLELPVVPPRWRRPLYWLLVLATALRIGWYLWNASGWQNSTRELMGMPDVEGTHYVRTLLVSAAIALLLIGLVWALIRSTRFVASIPHSYIQRRVASVVGGAVFLVLLVQTVNGTLVSTAITLINEAQATIDVSDPPGAVPPAEPARSGSPASLVAWDRLGRAGKRFVHEGPRKSDIEAFTGKEAKEPIRVYVGLRSADDTADQASLALEELKRTGAFSRKLLVIATPTGTGWVDNLGIGPLEYMHGGDTAVVGVQYSYLQSAFSLILEPGRSQASAAVVFQTIYRYWQSLPKEQRPKLYLFGLSLGSHGSETSAPLYAFVSHAISGAVWAGPPFRNALWRNVQRNRNPESTAWLPHFENASMIRVTGPYDGPEAVSGGWGPIRIVYVVNPSDSIVFFEENMWFREPDWMKQPRGPDLSPLLRWTPVITFLQVGLDMLFAAEVPPGHGHNYAVDDYADAWIEVSAPEGWTPSELARLKVMFANR
jgi:uncharacterized membrane protein